MNKENSNIRNLFVALMLGYSSGLPLLITATTLQAWLFERSVSLETLGVLSLIGLPYTLKFLWSPLFDSLPPLVLGQRRGWLLSTQIACMCSIAGLSLIDPIAHPIFFSLCALALAFFSASQDIVVDAHRRDSLRDEELGLGASLYIAGYRVGMLVSGALALLLADYLGSWPQVYQIMALFMLPGCLATFLAEEPAVHYCTDRPSLQAYIAPLKDLLRRSHIHWALIFIVLYKLGDTLAATMTTPFVLKLGFSKTDLALIVKSYGICATLLGSFAGGVALLRISLPACLLISGLLQMASTFGFVVLDALGKHYLGLASVITFENFASGAGTAAFVAYISLLSNKKFSATQYALLTGIMGIPRVLLASTSGALVEGLGWSFFFVLCTVVALPGLCLLLKAQPALKHQTDH